MKGENTRSGEREKGRRGGERRRERTKAHRLEVTCISISISCLKSSSRFAPVVYRMTHSCKAARSSSNLPRSETRGIKGAGARERESLRAQRRGRAQESETTRQESETTRTLLAAVAKQQQPLTPHALPRRNNLSTPSQHVVGSNAHKKYNPNMVYNV